MKKLFREEVGNLRIVAAMGLPNGAIFCSHATRRAILAAIEADSPVLGPTVLFVMDPDWQEPRLTDHEAQAAIESAHAALPHRGDPASDQDAGHAPPRS